MAANKSCKVLVAETGRGEAEEPERSDGNRLYGSIADKKAVGSKSITAFKESKNGFHYLFFSGGNFCLISFIQIKNKFALLFLLINTSYFYFF
ncbi:MAG: hypothetical protein E7053_06430 [Lentisphaerae bacterium]|nr:hypothetical protein [Lentisphaerota bacterium]